MIAAALALLAAACGQDTQKAEDGAKWLQERYLFRPFGDIGEISKVWVEDAGLIRIEVRVADPDKADRIAAQSLMLQTMIAKYACPKKTSKLWAIVGEDVSIRVALKHEDATVAKALCTPK